MRPLARIAAGRRTKWLVVLAWIVVLFAFAPLGAKLADVGDRELPSLRRGVDGSHVVANGGPAVDGAGRGA
jgi:uncharacterized membrane protein YdfJ with MMPL/SSD domain